MWFCETIQECEMYLLKVKKNVKLKSQLVKLKCLKCVTVYLKGVKCVIQQCEIEIVVISVKQTSKVKCRFWNWKTIWTDMSTCETDRFQMWNGLF